MSDVLIRGMDMPKNCWHCEFNKSTLDRYDFCSVNGKQYNWGLEERPSDCPLIGLPPHGRLIDADKLLAKENQHLEYLSDEWYVEVRTIENAPTVIEASEGEVMPDGTRR